jgi:hypothetical protein
VKAQRGDYCSVKKCSEVLPSVTVGAKINLGEIGVERKSFGAVRKCTHTQILWNNLTGRGTWKT